MPDAIRLAVRAARLVGFIVLAAVAMLLIALPGVLSPGAFTAIMGLDVLGRGNLSGLPVVVGAILALGAPYCLINTFIETRKARRRADLEGSLPPGSTIREHPKGGKLIRYARLEDGPDGPGWYRISNKPRPPQRRRRTQQRLGPRAVRAADLGCDPAELGRRRIDWVRR